MKQSFLEAFDKFPEFEFGEYKLRQIRQSDAENYFFYMNSPQVSEYINITNRVKSVEHAKNELAYWGGMFATKRGIYWGIALKCDDKLIGTAGYNSLMLLNRKCEISYDLDHEYWGKGVMIRSWKEIIKYSFETLNLRRIQASVVKTNKRSIKLLEKLGFQKEGILRNFETLDGVNMLDSYMYAKIS